MAQLKNARQNYVYCMMFLRVRTKAFVQTRIVAAAPRSSAEETLAASRKHGGAGEVPKAETPCTPWQ